MSSWRVMFPRCLEVTVGRIPNTVCRAHAPECTSHEATRGISHFQYLINIEKNFTLESFFFVFLAEGYSAGPHRANWHSSLVPHVAITVTFCRSLILGNINRLLPDVLFTCLQWQKYEIHFSPQITKNIKH